MLLRGSLDTSMEPQVLHYVLKDQNLLLGAMLIQYAADLDKRKSTIDYVFTLGRRVSEQVIQITACCVFVYYSIRLLCIVTVKVPCLE